MAEFKQYGWRFEKAAWENRNQGSTVTGTMYPIVGKVWIYYDMLGFIRRTGIVTSMDHDSGVVTDEDTIYVRG